MSARSLLLVALGATLALTGCGLGAGSTPDAPVGLSVTRDFGDASLVDLADAEVSGADTVMRVLQRNAQVRTRFGGEFVQQIGGVSGGRRDGRPVDWFLYINGILTDEGAGAIDVRGGDRIWWDHHDWGVTPDVRAVVGSYPEPFVHGSEGKRLPVRVECVDARGAPCKVVADKLVALGIPIGRSNISRSAADESLRILVGPWQRLRGRDAEADAIDDGPEGQRRLRALRRRRLEADGARRPRRPCARAARRDGPDCRDALEEPPAGVVRHGHRCARRRERRSRARRGGALQPLRAGDLRRPAGGGAGRVS